MASNPAPGDLELVRAFVNTLDVEERREDLSTPEATASWLAGRGLLDAATSVTPDDVDRARALREAIRATLRANHDGAPDPAAAAVLDAEACRTRIAMRFDAGGRAHVEPFAEGFDAALGRLLGVIAEAQREGTWSRLKVCTADDCQWAFYDRSRNRSAVWCDMAVCGNREKVRAYRRRGAEHADHGRG